MRFASVLALLALTSPVVAETLGPPMDQFSLSWSTPLTSQFTPWDKAPNVRMTTAKQTVVPTDLLKEAWASAADLDGRTNLALEEMANAFEPAQHTAFEDLRDAQRAYVATDGGDRTARTVQFVAMVHDLVEGRGRSVARDAASADDGPLNEAYAGSVHDAADAALPSLQATEQAWTDYRGAFERFAQAMERPDAVLGLHEELGRHRVEELRAVSTK